jgi:hypothetical protein
MAAVFEILYDSAKKEQLILIDGGICQFNLRRDGQLTILAIISIRPGAGSEMLERLKKEEADFIIAKCPADEESNCWYEKKGFKLIREEKTRTTDRKINVWRFDLQQPGLLKKKPMKKKGKKK